MNGNTLRQASSASSQEPRYGSMSLAQPPGRVLLDGYSKTLAADNDTYQSLSARSSRWKANDPVSMHLLMETAIGDSQQFEVLPPEEIDDLKKELSSISNRIEATKRKLILETKLRDAAHSINRLYSSKSREGSVDTLSAGQRGQRRLGSIGSNGDSLTKMDDDAQESVKKCEELAQDLWRLEKQEQKLQHRLLHHTAGVLQLTHKGYLKKEPTPEDLKSEQESVDGLYLSNGGVEFGDQSHYRPYSELVTNDMNYEIGRSGFGDHDFTQQNQMILDVESRVEDLNARLRDMILELKPHQDDLPQPPRELSEDPSHPGDILLEQIEFLENCLATMYNLQERTFNELQRPEVDVAAEEKLESLNTQLYNIMLRSSQGQNTKYTSPPEASGESLEDQLDYLEGGLGAVDRRLKSLGDNFQTSSSKLANYQERAEQYVSVIGGLWDILSASKYENTNNPPSDSTNDNINDEFSLQAFSIKVQEMHTRVLKLEEEKAALTTQIQHQQELESSADAAKDARMTSMRTEIETVKKHLEAAKTEANDHREGVLQGQAELEGVRQELALREREMEKLREAHDAMLIESDKRKEIGDLAEQKIQRLTAQLEEATDGTTVLEVNVLALRSDLDEKILAAQSAEKANEDLEAEVVRLHTELTVVKAELDGAYGTRAQRAAEVAADPALHKELKTLRSHNGLLSEEIAALKVAQASMGKGDSKLQAHVNVLQEELSETISDYEAMTKASIDYEKEREQLENLVDALRDRIENVDSELSDAKVQMIGIKSPGVPGGRDSMIGGNTSTMVLKNEFKKMMRETRTEYAKTISAEREERKRLEALIRSLKKEQMVGKSLAAQRMV